ncbi:MAG: HEAT repeat domain-containing protein [Gemmataceae bacterium]
MNRENVSRWFVRSLALLITASTVGLAPAEQSPNLHEQLKDSSPTVRAKAALTLAESNDAKAIPVLIDLLADLSAAERRPI